MYVLMGVWVGGWWVDARARVCVCVCARARASGAPVRVYIRYNVIYILYSIYCPEGRRRDIIQHRASYCMITIQGALHCTPCSTVSEYNAPFVFSLFKACDIIWHITYNIIQDRIILYKIA